MNKKNLIIITATFILILILSIYITKDDSLKLPENPYIEGKIYSISENRILIAEEIKGEKYDGDINNLIGSAIWLTIDEKTKIIDYQGKNITFEDLKTKNKVKAWTKGVILESYPAQGTALKIEIIEYLEENKNDFIAKPNNGNNKECFVGGCSGELCTDIPDAISTCELLPGMECLLKETSCQLIENKCTWVLSENAAKCFLRVEKEYGQAATETRIGHLFEKARILLEY